MQELIKTRANESRLEGLFFSLSEKYAVGNPYEEKLKNHPWEFKIQELQKGSQSFRIAISQQSFLTTLIVFTGKDDRNHFHLTGDEGGKDKKAFVLYDGKLAPNEKEAQFYEKAFRLQVKLPADHKFFNVFGANELLAELGLDDGGAEDMMRLTKNGHTTFSVCPKRKKVLLPQTVTGF